MRYAYTTLSSYNIYIFTQPQNWIVWNIQLVIAIEKKTASAGVIFCTSRTFVRIVKKKKNVYTKIPRQSHLVVHYGPQTHYANVDIIFGVAHVQLCRVSRSPFDPGTVQRIQSGSRVIRCIAVADPVRVHVHGGPCKQTKQQKWRNLSTRQIYCRGVYFCLTTFSRPPNPKCVCFRCKFDNLGKKRLLLYPTLKIRPPANARGRKPHSYTLSNFFGRNVGRVRAGPVFVPHHHQPKAQILDQRIQTVILVVEKFTNPSVFLT